MACDFKTFEGAIIYGLAFATIGCLSCLPCWRFRRLALSYRSVMTVIFATTLGLAGFISPDGTDVVATTIGCLVESAAIQIVLWGIVMMAQSRPNRNDDLHRLLCLQYGLRDLLMLTAQIACLLTCVRMLVVFIPFETGWDLDAMKRCIASIIMGVFNAAILLALLVCSSNAFDVYWRRRILILPLLVLIVPLETITLNYVFGHQGSLSHVSFVALMDSVIAAVVYAAFDVLSICGCTIEAEHLGVDHCAKRPLQ